MDYLTGRARIEMYLHIQAPT